MSSSASYGGILEVVVVEENVEKRDTARTARALNRGWGGEFKAHVVCVCCPIYSWCQSTLHL